MAFFPRVGLMHCIYIYIVCVFQGPPGIVTNPNEVVQILPIRKEVFQKLVFPDNCSNIEEIEAVR